MCGLPENTWTGICEILRPLIWEQDCDYLFYVIIQPPTINTLSFLEIKGSISPCQCFQSASLLWVFHLVKRHYITLKHDSPHKIHTVCRRSCYTSASEQLQHTKLLPPWKCLLPLNFTHCLQTTELEQEGAVWDGKSDIYLFHGNLFRLSSTRMFTALLFPRVQQDSTGCLPKEQLNTSLEDPDPSLPKHISSTTAHRSCLRYFQTKVKCIPSSQKPRW